MAPTNPVRPPDPTDTYVMVIILVGSIIAISIVSLVGYKALSTRSALREQRRRREEENRPPPTDSIEIYTIGIAKGHENLDRLWGKDNSTDDASQLSEESSSNLESEDSYSNRAEGSEGPV